MAKFTKIGCTCTAVDDYSASKVSASLGGRIADQVVIGTPGTLKRWINQRFLKLEKMRVLVFDEADQMLQKVCRFLFLFFCFLVSLILF